MSKRVRLSDASDDEELKLLLENFIRKSEVLEKKESDVLKHVQLVQSAVVSLQAWSPDGASFAPSAPAPASAPPATPRPFHPTPRVDVSRIEEETRAARRETERLQQEIREKIEENKRLEEVVSRRNSLLPRPALENVSRTEIETREPNSSTSRDLTHDSRTECFSDNLERLGAQDNEFKRQLDVQTERTRGTDEALEKKIEQLARESRLEKTLFHADSKTIGRK